MTHARPRVWDSVPSQPTEHHKKLEQMLLVALRPLSLLSLSDAMLKLVRSLLNVQRPNQFLSCVCNNRRPLIYHNRGTERMIPETISVLRLDMSYHREVSKMSGRGTSKRNDRSCRTT